MIKNKNDLELKRSQQNSLIKRYATVSMSEGSYIGRTAIGVVCFPSCATQNKVFESSKVPSSS